MRQFDRKDVCELLQHAHQLRVSAKAAQALIDGNPRLFARTREYQCGACSGMLGAANEILGLALEVVVDDMSDDELRQLIRSVTHE